MAHFTTAGKRYREGTEYGSFGAIDVGVTPPPAPPTTVDQTAPAELPDAGGPRKFLYWDTGRRITNKRRVRWTFSHADTWSTWHAVAYYGRAPRGGGSAPIVTLDAHWVGNGSLDPTPIDGPGSSFVDGPGAGQTAWPADGNDHAVRTEWGDATIRALDQLRRSSSDPQLDFSSLTQLVYGGDDSSVFEENDDGLTAGGGVTGIASTTAQELTFRRGSGAVVMAGYVQPAMTRDFIAYFERLIANRSIADWIKLQPHVDWSPDDVVRLRLLAQSLDLVRSERPDPVRGERPDPVRGERPDPVRGERPSDDIFGGLVTAARSMDAAELKRTITSTRATLRRGEAALKSLESLAAKAGKTRR